MLKHDEATNVRTGTGGRVWTPVFGAFPENGGVRFCVMAPDVERIELHIQSGAAQGTHTLEKHRNGVWDQFVPGAAAGDRYMYRLDGADLRPDPASRFQPEGVHGPSEVVDPARYRWRDHAWRGHTPQELVVYELHIGTFTAQGTFRSARTRLRDLRDLGVSAIEIMPIADFPGSRNWGYDGVALFAPSRAYGRPDDLRALVDDAHELGIGVILDVVYNHLGPEGAYLTQFDGEYLTDRHTTPWGNAINLDGPGSDVVRTFIIDNAVHWVREYHLDGLRLDATHALIDDSDKHLVAELAAAARRVVPWPLTVHAEDHRNLNTLLEEGGLGWGLDGVWADDFHHVIRRMIAGDTYGYYMDFRGTSDELARTIRQGWLFTGQQSRHMNEPRGTDASTVPMYRFVVCLQNHDQIGNRATGDRLHHTIELAAWRAVSTVLLTAPMTPLLFMGQEWAATTPFQYFTDLEPGLGRDVTEGRRREFKDFPEFADPESRERIPDPQAASTFEASRLNWNEREAPAHATTLALYQTLLALRSSCPALSGSDEVAGEAWPVDDDAIVVRRSAGGETFWIVARLRGRGNVDLDGIIPDPDALTVALSTEDKRFAIDARTLAVRDQAVRFERPGALILKQRRGPSGRRDR